MDKSVQRPCTNGLGKSVVSINFFFRFFEDAVSNEHSEYANYILWLKDMLLGIFWVVGSHYQ